ncbi:MAG TPA: hypothetical protein VJ959_10305 [Desulfotignum sp.]|nr:hypothetical protein [Desulfotignum sp.]
MPFPCRDLIFGLNFRKKDANRPRPGLKISRWQRYRRWLGEVPLLETLPPEHWLIHARPLTGIHSL